MHDFELIVGAAKYSGWKSLRLTRSIEQLAHSFNVELTDRWTEGQEAVPVEAGDPCVVRVDGDVVVTGYVDEDSQNYDAKNRTLSFSGRSKTGDLIDCAAVHKGGQWRNTGMMQIAKDLCMPFGISATTKVDLGKKFRNPNFKIQEGESAFEAISRGARMRGVLTLTDAEGNLFFDRVGSTVVETVIGHGDNIISGSRRNSWSSRFGAYTIKTQSSGNDEHNGKATSIKRSSTDDLIDRYRPTVILADNEDSGTELQKRADWERNVRAGQARRWTYTVPGWRHSKGLWEPNTLVRVVDRLVNDTLLIASATFVRGPQGTTTQLDLTIKEAFDVQPLPKPNQKKGAAR